MECPQTFESGASAVMVSVVFASLFGMMRGVVEVPFGDVRVVAGLFMIARFMVFGGVAMVFGGEFVVLCCLAMMICCFYGHGKSPMICDVDVVPGSLPTSLTLNYFGSINGR